MAAIVGSAGLLEGRRVLDLSGPMGVYCGKVLADLGADVIKIEHPRGDPMRRIPPFKNDLPHYERSLYFQYYNLNKRGITLDLETSDGKALFRRLVEKVDIVVEAFPIGFMEGLGLSYSALNAVNPGIIVASITPFGLTGPYKDYKASDLVGFAVGMPLLVSGTPEGPPCVAPGQLSFDSASLTAAIGALVAVQARWLNGRGQHIDVSVQESTIAGTADWSVPYLAYMADRRQYSARRTGTRGAGVPGDTFPCRDGFVKFCVIPQTMWRSFLDWIGRPEEIAGPEWNSMGYRMLHRDIVDACTTAFTVQHTREELFVEGQRRGIAISPIYRPDEYMEDPQPKGRQFFVEVEHPEIGKFITPGLPYRFSSISNKPRRPAPQLGQHNVEVYCDDLGLSQSDLVSLKYAGVV